MPQVKRVSKKLLRDRLEWVKAQITAHPRKYDQGNFCGSVCCIAGWLDVHANGSKVHADRMKPVGEEDHIDAEERASEEVEVIGKKELGVRVDPWLFSPGFEERVKLSDAFYEALTPKARAAVACQAIDTYLKERKA